MLTLRLLVAAVCAGCAASPSAPAPKADGRCFEMRTYVAKPGKLEALQQRFRAHTLRIFARHGMELIGFWTLTEGPDADRTLVYVLAYPSRAARDAAWKAFGADSEWAQAKAESEKDGVLVEKATERFLTATDLSPIR